MNSLSIIRELTSKVFEHIGWKGIGNILIRIQYRHFRFEIFCLFYELSYFHPFAICSLEKNPLWKRSCPHLKLLVHLLAIRTPGYLGSTWLWLTDGCQKFSYIFVYLVVTFLLMKCVSSLMQFYKKSIDVKITL